MSGGFLATLEKNKQQINTDMAGSEIDREFEELGLMAGNESDAQDDESDAQDA